MTDAEIAEVVASIGTVGYVECTQTREDVLTVLREDGMLAEEYMRTPDCGGTCPW
jgi:hypothetical protein